MIIHRIYTATGKDRWALFFRTREAGLRYLSRRVAGEHKLVDPVVKGEFAFSAPWNPDLFYTVTDTKGGYESITVNIPPRS